MILRIIRKLVLWWRSIDKRLPTNGWISYKKFTTKLVKKYDIIVLEKLNTKGMMKNHHLARAIANASWSKLVDILQYKCDWYGKKLIQS